MIKRLILISFILTGCTTVPVVQKFPEPPKDALVKCQPLVKLEDDAKLSDVANSIIHNYALYNTCDVKNDAWIEWYGKQKQIFEGIK